MRADVMESVEKYVDEVWEDVYKRQEKHGVPVSQSIEKPYSIDDNLWGRAIEAGVLEDPWAEPPADIWTMTVDPLDAPDVPTCVEVGFAAGVPTSLDGEELPLPELIAKLNVIVGSCGYGPVSYTHLPPRCWSARGTCRARACARRRCPSHSCVPRCPA